MKDFKEIVIEDRLITLARIQSQRKFWNEAKSSLRAAEKILSRLPVNDRMKDAADRAAAELQTVKAEIKAGENGNVNP